MTQPSVLDAVKGIAGSAVRGVTGGSPAAPVPRGKVGTLADARKALLDQMPDPATYGGDAVSFQDDLATWTQLLSDVNETLGQQQAAEWGYVTLPDGTVMPTGDLDPEQRAIFEQANEAKYQNSLQQLGLQQSQMIAERRQADFDNQMTRTDQSMRQDDARLRQAESKINRQLGGLDESRQRAKTVADTKLAAAPYATQGGKSSFSGNDLGGAIGEFARFAGIDPSQSLLNYQGTSMVDPESDMSRFDSLLGVGGPLEGIPDLQQFGIADAPDLGAVPQLSLSRVNLGSLLQAAQPAAETFPINRPDPGGIDFEALRRQFAPPDRNTGLSRETRDRLNGGPPVWQSPGFALEGSPSERKFAGAGSPSERKWGK